MTTVFDQIALAFSHVLGTDVFTAGLILGLATVFVLMVSMATIFIALRVPTNGPILILIGAAGVAFVVGVGWWQPWTAILIIIVCAVLIVRPFLTGGGRGE